VRLSCDPPEDMIHGIEQDVISSIKLNFCPCVTVKHVEPIGHVP